MAVRTIDIEGDFSLNVMWQAFQSERSSGVKSSLTTAGWPHGSPWGSNWDISFGSTKSGAGVGQSIYIGQFADNSGLSYLNARYYSPSQGQFLSEDPIFVGNPSQQNLQDPQSLNSYSYSEDNPIVKEDPWGKDAFGNFVYNSFVPAGEQNSYNQLAVDLSNSSPAWDFAINHPYTTAAITAAASYPALTIAGSAAAAFSMAAAPGVSTAFAAQQAVAGSVYFTLAAHNALEIPGLIGAFSQANPGNFPSYFPAALSATEHFGPSAFDNTYPGALYDTYEFASILGNAANNLFSNSVQARTQTAQTFNSAISSSGSGSNGSGPSASSLWVTPSGAVVSFGGQLVSGPPTSK